MQSDTMYLFTTGAVCQTDNGCQPRVATIGSSLSIHCNVSCGNVEWGLQGSDQPVSHGRSLQLQVLNVSIGGRVYWCRCHDDECAGLFVVAKRVIGREERRVSEREGEKERKGERS